MLNCPRESGQSTRVKVKSKGSERLNELFLPEPQEMSIVGTMKKGEGEGEAEGDGEGKVEEESERDEYSDGVTDAVLLFEGVRDACCELDGLLVGEGDGEKSVVFWRL